MQAAEALAAGMKRLRKRLGLTQAALAEAAGLHVQYVSPVERRQRSPAMDTIDRIADALGVSAAELFSAGEGRASSRTAEVTDQVEALLSAWSGKDRDKLVNILVELRRVAGSKRRPRRGRSS